MLLWEWEEGVVDWDAHTKILCRLREESGNTETQGAATCAMKGWKGWPEEERKDGVGHGADTCKGWWDGMVGMSWEGHDLYVREAFVVVEGDL